MPSAIRKKSYNSATVYSIDEQVVLTAAQRFADESAQRPEVLAVVLFGSLAEERLGVGSDVDILLVLTHSDRPFLDRSPFYMPDRFPVDLDLFPYTLAEIRGGQPLAREALEKGRLLWQRAGFDLAKISAEEVAE